MKNVGGLSSLMPTLCTEFPYWRRPAGSFAIGRRRSWSPKRLQPIPSAAEIERPGGWGRTKRVLDRSAWHFTEHRRSSSTRIWGRSPREAARRCESALSLIKQRPVSQERPPHPRTRTWLLVGLRDALVLPAALTRRARGIPVRAARPAHPSRPSSELDHRPWDQPGVGGNLARSMPRVSTPELISYAPAR